MLDLINRFDTAMAAFHESLAERLRRILQMSNRTMEVDISISTYVIPGYTYELHVDDNQVFRIWIGANFKRLFFITRVRCTPEQARKAYQFTFGGAETIGWHVNYEAVGENETSIWATRMCEEPLVEDYCDERNVAKAELTKAGAFWAIDIGMMVQSLVRTSQRERILPSTVNPEPL